MKRFLLMVLLLVHAFGVVAQSPSIADYLNSGAAKGVNSDHYGAINDFTQALKINPRSEEALYNRALSYLKLKKHKQAIADLNQLILIAPEHAQAYNQRGVAKTTLGDYNAALRDFDEALLIMPNEALFLKNRGIAKYFNGMYESAIDDLRLSLSILQKSCESYFYLGLSSYMVNRKKDACEYFSQSANLGCTKAYDVLKAYCTQK